ncbi:hypothetical protein P7C73_g3746, partial [Tremellales sp. Uapishka_1]
MPLLPPPTASSSTTPPPTAGRVFKGFLKRVTSPEPREPTKSRLRSLVGDSQGQSSRQKAEPKRPKDIVPPLPLKDTSAKPRRQRTLSNEVATGRRQLQQGVKDARSRPSSPELTHRNIRFAPHPAIRQDDEGRWQPPSLSRGSLSTSALAFFTGDDSSSPIIPLQGQATNKPKRGHKHSLSLLFHSGRFGGKPHVADSRGKAEGEALPESPVKRGSPSRSPILAGSDTSPEMESLQVRYQNYDNRGAKPSRSRLHSPKSPLLPSSPDQEGSQIQSPRLVSRATTPAPASPGPMLPPAMPRSRSSSGTPPTRSRSNSGPPPLLSHHHYVLRLTAAYMVRSLTSVVKASEFAGIKTAEVKALAEEKIATLSRMEKAWGSEWNKAAILLTDDELLGEGDLPAAGSTQAKVRAVIVSERTKERERQVWLGTLRDGVLLCLLLNQLFPVDPPLITRLHVSPESLQRATNVTRFITGCQGIGLRDDELFGLTDLNDATEASLGRVAMSIIRVIRLAGKSRAALRSSRPGLQSSNAPSPPTSPRRIQPKRPPSALRESSTSPKAFPFSNGMERSRSQDGANELVSKLQYNAQGPDDPAWRTPTTPVFSFHSEPAIAPPRSVRTPSPPEVSPRPIKALSPPPVSPSGMTSANPRASPRVVRPNLKTRQTTNPKHQVSFADSSEEGGPRTMTSDRSGTAGMMSHSRERTPSLISSSSRITSSAYTRSSAAYSVSTVIGDEHAIDLAFEDDDDRSLATRLRIRRTSERTLQDARQKILGTILKSSDDLPHDLQLYLADEVSTISTEDARGAAHSQSLAALEGASPRSRPIVRRGQSLDVARPLVEEDEFRTESSISSESKPSIFRRGSSNGKFYIPKRPNSPQLSPPLSGGYFKPDSASTAKSRGSSTLASDAKAEHRLSEGLPDRTPVLSDPVRPTGPRLNSMVNLSNLAAAGGHPSLIRGESSPNVVKSAATLQVLEFNEPGYPPVKYQLGNCIGRGQFGSVYRSLNLGTGQMAAIKRIRLEGMKEPEVRDVMREVELLQRFSHPSIVKYEGMSRDEHFLNIVLEYVENGSLGSTLKAFGKFNERLVSSYVAKILEGLIYLHSQGVSLEVWHIADEQVVHCDLKAANILSTKNGNVKLSDFGVSLNVKAVESIQHDALTASKLGGPVQSMAGVAGTPNWMAPEVISLAGASPASDIWSLGCTIIELLTGKPPYSDITNSMTVLFRIVEDDMPPLPDVSPELSDFLKLCFIKNPHARPAAAVLFEHHWLRGLNPELDSVPFMRRVSGASELRKVDSSLLFSQAQDAGRYTPSRGSTHAPEVAADRRRSRISLTGSHGREGSDGTSASPKSHVLIKTTFGKAIICRVCHTGVKKVGVLCQNCGLLCHTGCANRAAPRCDIREQLSLFARQQEALEAAGGNDVDRLTPPPVPIISGEILSGWRRSKTSVSSDPPPSRDASSPFPDFRRRSSTSVHTSHLPMGRQSIHADRSIASRGSAFSTSSVDVEEQRMGGFPSGDAAPKIKQHSVSTVEQVRAKGHQRGKDSKSECLVM